VSIVRGRKVLGGGGFGLQHRLRGRQVRNRNSGQGPGTCRLQAKESVPPWLAICHQEAVHAKLRTSSARKVVAPNVLTVRIRQAGVGRCEATCDTTERTPNRQSMRAMEVAVRVLRDLRSESARADTGEAPTAARPPPRPAGRCRLCRVFLRPFFFCGNSPNAVEEHRASVGGGRVAARHGMCVGRLR